MSSRLRPLFSRCRPLVLFTVIVVCGGCIGRVDVKRGTAPVGDLIATSFSSVFQFCRRRFLDWLSFFDRSMPIVFDIKWGDTDGAANVDASTESDETIAEEPSSVVLASLNLYKEALANSDDSKVAEIESFLKSIEEENFELEKKMATISEELSYEKARVLRISADFDNFCKRTERELLSVVSNAQGEVVENLSLVLDNFERAKSQIKVETEGEEKISNSYQSIYKQFVEIMGSIGVVPVETVGKPFDPMLHEAIMREESTEYEDGIIIEQYRKGFQLGERLLRPSMVKVSAGPGPAEPETVAQSEEQEGEEDGETISETTQTEG